MHKIAYYLEILLLALHHLTNGNPPQSALDNEVVDNTTCDILYELSKNADPKIEKRTATSLNIYKISQPEQGDHKYTAVAVQH